MEGQPSSKTEADAWPRDLDSCVGTRLSFQGRAFEAKLGPVLLPPSDDSGQLWIEGLGSWPDDFERGQRVVVSGVVRVRTVVNPPTSRTVLGPDGRQQVEYSAGPGEGSERKYILVVEGLEDIKKLLDQ